MFSLFPLANNAFAGTLVTLTLSREVQNMLETLDREPEDPVHIPAPEGLVLVNQPSGLIAPEDMRRMEEELDDSFAAFVRATVKPRGRKPFPWDWQATF